MSMTPATVADVMTGDLVTVRSDDPVGWAREILLATGLHALPVMHGEIPTGVVTLADCGDHVLAANASEVVTTPPITIAADASVAEAAGLMRSERVHHLLVTETDSGEIQGILSTLDLIALLT